MVANVFVTGKEQRDGQGSDDMSLIFGTACVVGSREQLRPGYSFGRARIILVIPAVARGSLPDVVGKGISANGDQFKAPVGVFSHLYLLN